MNQTKSKKWKKIAVITTLTLSPIMFIVFICLLVMIVVSIFLTTITNDFEKFINFFSFSGNGPVETIFQEYAKKCDIIQNNSFKQNYFFFLGAEEKALSQWQKTKGNYVFNGKNTFTGGTGVAALRMPIYISYTDPKDPASVVESIKGSLPIDFETATSSLSQFICGIDGRLPKKATTNDIVKAIIINLKDTKPPTQKEPIKLIITTFNTENTTDHGESEKVFKAFLMDEIALKKSYEK
jgi:hypothetical protein